LNDRISEDRRNVHLVEVIMADQDLLERIVSDPDVVGGRPRVRGTRLTVRYIVGLLAAGASIEEILADHPSLSRDDVLASLRYAAESLEQQPPVANTA
jgi:uncharacterized protein (DUF433 family)